MDQWSEKRKPFFFILDYENEKPLVFPLRELKNNPDILVHFPHFKNHLTSPSIPPAIVLPFTPFPFEKYQKSFDFVQKNIQYGNSYLTNLTFPTQVYPSYDLRTLFEFAQAPYKLLYKDTFCCFSPEKFIQISKDQRISTFPMKGTLDASLPNAENVLLENEKENAEHCTVVDLLRNDLSKVAKEVEVTRFRYLETIKSAEKNILQSSSAIEGILNPAFQNRIGSVLEALLPAGSISGAPKEKTQEIIRDAEMDKRGYYTGIMGIFDGETLDSAVMIRFLEKKNNEYFYRSGGGITSMSTAVEEYEELLNKIYVPIF